VKKQLTEDFSSINILFVPGKGEPDDKELNYDAKTRCLAVKEIYWIPESKLEKVYFVGGNPEEGGGIAVSQQMKNYSDTIMNPKISNAVFKSNNTVGNVNEIIGLAEKQNLNCVFVLANKYQLPRFLRIFKKQGLDESMVIPIVAEDVLMLNNSYKEEMVKNLRSFKYKMRIFLEKLLIIWMIFDPQYKWITKFRKFRRSKLSRTN